MKIFRATDFKLTHYRLPTRPPVPGRYEDPPVGAAVDPISAGGELVAAGHAVRQVGPGAIPGWLAGGWRDLMRTPGVSLAIGLLCTVVGWALIAAMLNAQSAVLILPLLTGFMLAAPVVAVPLYDTSRRLSRGEPVSLGSAIGSFVRNRWGIGFMGALLMLFLYGWLRVATMLWALFFGMELPPLGDFLPTAFSDIPFVIVSFGVGGVLATAVFATSAVSLPMLVDRPVDPVTAAATSVRTCLANPLTMALWAVTIVVVTGIGVALGLLGLVVTVPLIGHATWHAYADLIAPEAEVPPA